MRTPILQINVGAEKQQAFGCSNEHHYKKIKSEEGKWMVKLVRVRG